MTEEELWGWQLLQVHSEQCCIEQHLLREVEMEILCSGEISPPSVDQPVLVQDVSAYCRGVGLEDL